MVVDGLEVDADADAEDDGEARGLLCGADGPGGDMKDEEEVLEVSIPTGPSSTRVEPQAAVLQAGQHGWMLMVLKSMLMLMMKMKMKMERQEDFLVEQTDPEVICSKRKRRRRKSG